MGQRNFYFKKYLPLMDGWAVLCGLFGFLFILSRAKFESPQTTKLFVFSYIGYLLIMAILGALTHGGFRLFKIKIEHKNSFLINTFIINGHIDPNISDQNLNKFFYYLKKENFIAFKQSTFYSGVMVLSSIITMWLWGTSAYNLITILMGGGVAIILFSLFPLFMGEKIFAGLLRECRKILIQRDIRPNENIQLQKLENKFYYLVALFGLIVVIILSFVPKLTPLLFAIIITGFMMVIIIAKTLFSSIISIFQEVKNFANELAQGKRTEYLAGTSYKEVLSLSNDLTKSAQNIYDANEKEKLARKEAEEKSAELEKWYHLTVGRELKMVELKNKIKQLEK